MRQAFCLVIMSTFLLGCGAANNEAASIRNKGVIYCAEGAPETFNPQLVTSVITIDATSHQIYNRLIEYQTTDNEAERNDKEFKYVAAWGYNKNDKPSLFKEDLKYKNVKLKTRSYK